MSDEAAPQRELTGTEQNTVQAVTDLDDILSLKKNPAYKRYFQRRMIEKRLPLERALLSEELSDMDTRKKKAQLAMLKEIETMFEDDERGNRSIISMRNLPT